MIRNPSKTPHNALVATTEQFEVRWVRTAGHLGSLALNVTKRPPKKPVERRKECDFLGKC